MVVLGACGIPFTPPAPTPVSTPSPADIRPPHSPSNLVGEPISQTIVSLQWLDNSDNEEGFKIYRDGNIVETVGANNTVYQDTGLEAGKTYHYVAKAYNAAGESGTCSCIVKTLNPPLNVTISYIGVMFDHDHIGPGDIRLVLFVSDGNPANDVEEIIPPGEGSYTLNDYEVLELNQRIFHTAAAGEYLKIVIIAYEDDQETFVSDILQAALPVLGPILGIPYASEISAIFSQYEEQTGKPLFENKDDYVGYFQGFWSSDESWGIGQYNSVGIDDLRAWLSVWSDSQPEPLIKPTLEFSVDFDGWYVEGDKVDTATKHDRVVARINLSGGEAGYYKLRIRRDVRGASDTTVDEVSFRYDGVSVTKELPFNPPYATGEANTDGYHIDLLKDGYTIWTLTDAYPPRLRVTTP